MKAFPFNAEAQRTQSLAEGIYFSLRVSPRPLRLCVKVNLTSFLRLTLDGSQARRTDLL